MSSTAVVVLLFTAASAEEATRIGRILVEERLAACVNVLPSVRSIYRWKGKVEDGSEALALVKTRRENLDRLIARIKALHAYEVPEAIALEVVAGNPDYLAWVAENSA